jgi:hypothetical protein
MSLSITKKFRQLWRTDNGAGYQAVTEEGTELLLLGSNGSRLSHVLQGIDLDAALSLAGEPNWQQGVGDSLGEILKAQPPPYVSGSEPEQGAWCGRCGEPIPTDDAPGYCEACRTVSLREPEPVTPRVTVERRQAKAPEPPADPLLDASARYIAKRVWAMGSRWPADIWPRGTVEDEKRRVLDYAQAQGWIVVEPSSQVSKGTVHPEPVLPYKIPNGDSPRRLG